jgi:ABC-type nitrate/sulfonate/bicarbonate transport system permease component
VSTAAPPHRGRGVAGAAGVDPAPAPVRSRRAARSTARRLLPPAAVLVGVFALWQLLTTGLHVDPTILPGPRLIVASTWDDRANIWPAITTTTEESVLGLLLAVGVAVPLAVAIDWSRAVRGSIYPLVVASQTLPIIALAPLVVIWFGFGLVPKIVLVALFSFFPVAVGTVQGLASADEEAMNLLRTMRATRWQLLTRVRFPGALPQLFTGLKISVTYAFTSAIVAEFVGATQGLGVYMTAAGQAAPRRTDLVFGATLVTALLTIALFLVVGVLQRLAMPWRPGRRA